MLQCEFRKDDTDNLMQNLFVKMNLYKVLKMKIIKKTAMSICSLALICSMMVPTGVSASSGYEGEVIYNVPVYEKAGGTASLGTSGSVKFAHDNFDSYDTYRTEEDYNTNSTKLVLRIKSSSSNRISVRLYDSEDELIGGKEINATGTSQTITFTNLVSIEDYHFEFENIGVKKVNISGSVAAK